MDYGHTQNNSITTSDEYDVSIQQSPANMVDNSNPFKAEDNLNTANFDVSTISSSPNTPDASTQATESAWLSSPVNPAKDSARPTDPANSIISTTNQTKQKPLSTFLNEPNRESSGELGEIISTESSQNNESAIADFMPPNTPQEDAPINTNPDADSLLIAEDSTTKSSGKNALVAVVEAVIDFTKKFQGNQSNNAAEYYEIIRGESVKYQGRKEKENKK
ncbi:hypothetical protein IJG04_00085, partial [Candidatus Saccharibacteria bacterium]|nr:hypothetical protein [Candidatus Saccharibacteria bacterium]